MKFTKTHEKQLREFMKLMDRYGCVPVRFRKLQGDE